MTAEQMARMERELEKLNQDFRAAEATFGDDVVQLVLASKYVGRMIGNAAVANYLGERHPDIIGEFDTILNASSFDAM